MKFKHFLVVAVLLVLGLASCDDSSWRNDDSYRNWVTITDNDKQPAFKTDGGTYLRVSNDIGTDTTYNEIGDRGSLLFTLVDDEEATGSVYPIVMKEFVKATVKNYTLDSTTNVVENKLNKFQSAIVSNDYLNCLVKVYDAESPDNNMVLVRYVSQETHNEYDSLPVIRLQLEHHATTVKETTTTQAYCFNLLPLVAEFPGKSGFVLRLSWEDDSEAQEYDLRYTPSN